MCFISNLLLFVKNYKKMAKTYHCWRCDIPIPMLTDEEWDVVRPLLRIDIEYIKSYREQSGVGLREAMDTLRFKACEKYFELTGFKETNPNALWHHYLSHYGPECSSCGHLLRTTEAVYCANCGKEKS